MVVWGLEGVRQRALVQRGSEEESGSRDAAKADVTLQVPRAQESRSPVPWPQKFWPSVPSSFWSPVSQALFFSDQRWGDPQLSVKSGAQVGPAPSDPGFARARRGDSRAVGGALPSTGGARPQFKISRLTGPEIGDPAAAPRGNSEAGAAPRPGPWGPAVRATESPSRGSQRGRSGAWPRVPAGGDSAPAPGLPEAPPVRRPGAEQEFPGCGDSASAKLGRTPRLRARHLGAGRREEEGNGRFPCVCAVTSARRLGCFRVRPPPLNPFSAGTRKVSRNERNHCPSQTVKKLLEEQRRRQQQPDAGGAPGQFPPLLAQPLTPSVNQAEVGHTHFPAHQETVGSGLGNLAPATGFPDWNPNTHAAYTDSLYSYPTSAAESFLTSDFCPPSDPGQPYPFPLGMEDPLDTRLYPEPSLPQVGSWKGSGLTSGPPQLPPVVTGPSLDTARAHMVALGPQRLLAQDEEGDTLLHLLAARGLRWAAYAAAEVFQMYRYLDVREHKGKTPLLVAAAANQPLIVEDLLNLGAEPNATDHQGRSVLHVAATYGLPGVLSAVINSGVRVDLEARDFEGLTPLHTAILALNVAMLPPDLGPRMLSTQARDRLSCVQMLLHMGADHTSQEIKSNKTVLHLAVQAANPTLVQLLLELPQGDLRAFVNMKAHGNTALHMAAALPPGPPQEAIVRSLLAAGADPTLRNLENEQPVHLLRPGPGPEGLRQLLKRSRVAPPGLSS